MVSHDRISRPAKGRYFPVTAQEIAKQIEAAKFAVHSYHKRLPLFMENCLVECDRGKQICSFLRMSYLAAFSVELET
jgi:hypothetical protein